MTMPWEQRRENPDKTKIKGLRGKSCFFCGRARQRGHCVRVHGYQPGVVLAAYPTCADCAGKAIEVLESMTSLSQRLAQLEGRIEELEKKK